MKDLPLTDNRELCQYEMLIDNNIARVRYKKVGTNEIILTHTEIPEALQGKGLGSILANKVLTRIKQENLKVTPLCPFMAAYIEKHPEWKEILA